MFSYQFIRVKILYRFLYREKTASKFCYRNFGSFFKLFSFVFFFYKSYIIIDKNITYLVNYLLISSTVLLKRYIQIEIDR